MKEKLRRGDIVEVLSLQEIIATLDEDGNLESLPFMPEMAQYAGRRFTIDRRAEKICDTINWTGSRRIKNTVILEDIRCDGSYHDGCQAECRTFWKESWLRRIDGETRVHSTSSKIDQTVRLESLPLFQVKKTISDNGKTEEIYRCQATQLYHASTRLRVFDPRPYFREFTCGNIPLGRFLRVTLRAVTWEPLRKIGLFPKVPIKGRQDGLTKSERLDLQVGEWVRVKSKEEIADRLNLRGRNRGLFFDREMLPFCGGTYKVRKRISQFIDDRNGQMIRLKTDCVTLDGVYCSGELSLRRWFCPRAIYPYWRESWLERVDNGDEN